MRREGVVAKPKLSREERDRAMGEVAKLTARGYRQEEIARRLDLSQSMVSYYLQRLKKTAFELGADELTARRLKVLRELEEVRREAWEAWEKSKEKVELFVIDGEVVEHTVETPGDAKYMAAIVKAIESERELLGLDVNPEDMEGGNAGGWEILAKLIPGRIPVDEVEAEISRVLPPHDPLKNGHAGTNGTGKHKG